jgi:hypothetical protein
MSANADENESIIILFSSSAKVDHPVTAGIWIWQSPASSLDRCLLDASLSPGMTNVFRRSDERKS